MHMENRTDIMINLGMRTSTDDPDTVFEEVIPKEEYMPKDHRFLFDFLSVSLKRIHDLLEEAVANREQGKAKEADTLLKKTRPFFFNTEARTAYINRSLAEIIRNDPNLTNRYSLLEQIGLPFNGHFDSEYWLSSDFKKGTIRSLIEKQEDCRKKIVLLFDDTNPDLAKTPMSVRAGLYGMVGNDADAMPIILNVQCRYILPAAQSMRVLQASMDFDDNFSNSVLNAVADMEKGKMDTPPVLKKILGAADSGETVGYTEYSAEYLEDILDLEICFFFFEGVRLKRCRNCGRYFPVSPLNDKYCNIEDVNGNSCLKNAAREELKKQVDQIYTQAYRSHFARVKNGKESKEYLDKWRPEAKRLQEEVYQFKVTLPEYKRILMLKETESGEK